jgi:hypothetical protein
MTRNAWMSNSEQYSFNGVQTLISTSTFLMVNVFIEASLRLSYQLQQTKYPLSCDSFIPQNITIFLNSEQYSFNGAQILISISTFLMVNVIFQASLRLSYSNFSKQNTPLYGDSFIRKNITTFFYRSPTIIIHL